MGWEEDVRDLRLGGGTDADVAQLQASQESTLQEGGASPEVIDSYFGRKKPDTSSFVKRLKENVAAAQPESSSDGPPAAKHDPTFGEAFDAGWQMSIAGLMKGKPSPDVMLPENAGWAKRLVASSTQWAADLPFMIAGQYIGSTLGGLAGGAAGTEAPVLGPVTPIAGAVTGSVVLGGAGAFALPAFIRRELMDHYEKGDIQDFSDFFVRHAGATADALKEGTVGALSAATGGTVKAVLGGPLGGYGVGGAVRSAASSLAEVGMMTTAGKAMEGKVASAQDYIDGAVMIGALHIATHGPGAVKDVAGKMRDVYARTNIGPDVQAQEAAVRPSVQIAFHEKGDNHIEISDMLGGAVEDQPIDKGTAAKNVKEAQATHPDDIPASQLADVVPPFDGQAAESVPRAAVAPSEVLSSDFSHGSAIKSVYATEAPAPGGLLQSGDVPPWEMTHDQVEARIQEQDGSDKKMLVDLFGESGAKRYSQLERQQDSLNHERADAASNELAAMHDKLTEAQQRRLFGIGEAGPSVELLKDIRQAHLALDDSSPKALGASLKYAVTRAPTETDPSKMSYREIVALSQIHEAMRIAQEKGWDTKAISDAALKGSAARFSDPEDAAFMLDRFKKAAEQPAQIEATAGEPAPPVSADSYAQLSGKKKKQSQAREAFTLDAAFKRDVDIARDLPTGELKQHLENAEAILEQARPALERFKSGSKKPGDLAAGDTARRVQLFKDILATRSDAVDAPTADVSGLRDARAKLEKQYLESGSMESAENPDPYHEFGSRMHDLPPEVAQRFQVHGVGGSNPDASLIDLLTNGIDSSRAFHSGPPTPGSGGVDSTRTWQPYLLLSDPGKSLTDTGVKTVVLNGPSAANESALRIAFPKVEFLTVDEAVRKMAEAPPSPPSAPPAEASPSPSEPGHQWTPEEAERHINGQINADGNPPDARPWSTRFNDAWRGFYKNVWDRMSPLLNIERDLAGKRLSEADALSYSRMRSMAGNFDKGVSIVEQGPIDFATKERLPDAKGLPEILQSVPDPVRLRNFAVAKRVLEKTAQNIETGVNPEAAKAFVDAHAAEYEPAFRDLVKFQDGVMNYLIDSGVVSQASAEKFRLANQDFVPFHRLIEGEASGSSLKEMKGSTRAIIDPLQSMIKNVHTFVHLADINEAKGALVARSEESGNAAGLFDKIKSDVDVEKLQALIDAFAEHGEEFGGLRAKDLVAFDPVRNPETDIRYLRDGKPETYRTTKDVASILNGTDREQLPAIFKVLSYPAKLERAGILSGPAFMVRHAIRNPIMAMFYTHNGLMPWDLARGMASYFSEIGRRAGLNPDGGKDFQDALAGGMGQRVSDVLDRDYLQKDVFELSKKTGLMDTVINAIKSPAEAMHAIASITDNSIRMSEYLKARDSGKSIQDAAYDARRVIADPSRSGAAMRVINSTVPFFHMEWQGMDMLWRAAMENPARFGFAASGIAAASALVWALGKGDSRMDETPDYERDLFWCIPTDDWRPIDQTSEAALTLAMSRPDDQRREINGKIFTNEGAVLKIPKPFQAGIIFGSGTERALDAYYKEKPDAFEGFGASLLGSMYRMPIPAFAKPMIEQFANKSTFTGSPIVPESVMHELPEYRYTDATSEPAKLIAQLIPTVPAIGRSIAVSPMVIDNYIKSYSGDVGAYVLDVVSRGLHAAGVGSAASRPSGHELIGGLEDDVPFVRAFVVRHPSASARSIQQFHDSDAEFQMIKATLQAKAKEGDDEAAAKLEQVQAVEYQGVDLSQVHASMAVQAHAIRLIYENHEMSPVEKRQSIDGLYYAMAASARLANDTLRQARKLAETKGAQ